MGYFSHLVIVMIILVAKSILLSKCNNLSTDGTALFAIKNKMLLDSNPALLNNWTQETSFCYWKGVSCGRRHRRVTSLRLTSLGLSGTIAREIGNLSFLVFLDISNNSFHGTIPEEIGFLHRLRHLSLSSNQLEGRISLTFGSLEGLQLLDLSNNNLTETIPFTIFNISSMRILDLYHNQISGTLPKDICRGTPLMQSLSVASNQLGGEMPSLGDCGRVIYLSLSYNKFTGSVPREVGNLTRLQEFYLEFNNLTGTLPQDIGNALSMRRMNFHSNQLVGIFPPSLGNLSNLEMLDLGYNIFHGNILVNFEHLSNLQELYLSSTNLNGKIPTTIFNISNIQVIVLTNTNISGTLPLDIAVRLPNLQYLLLAYNQITGPIPLSISNATNLVSLSFGYNLFTGNIPMNLGNLRKLQFLSMQANQLTNTASEELEFLNSMTNCSNLITLRIGYNPLKGVLPSSIGNLSSTLQTFHATDSGLKGEIPKEIGNLRGLTWLSLAKNDLSGHLPSTIGSLRILQRLRIYDNLIQGELPFSFCNLRNLYEVYLSRNKFSGELPSCLGNMSAIRILYMNSNKLSSFLPTTMWNNKDMLFVNLSSNFFNGTLSTEIGTVTRLTELHLADNNFHGEIPASIGDLQDLVTLSLSSNMLDGPIPDKFGDMVSLEELDLSFNNISHTIPKTLEKLVHLSYLNLSFNLLSGEIPQEGPFRNFTSMSFIGNTALCGSPQLNIVACRSTSSTRVRITNSLVFKYVLSSCIITVVLIILITLIIRYRYTAKMVSVKNNLELTHRFSYFEILKATGNFGDANKIGRGSSGSVYKATFLNGMVAAVKTFNLDIQETLGRFDIECEVMKNIRHRNLVKVISTCSNMDFKAIIMVFMPMGSLEKWLYAPDCCLDLVERLRILIDVASALEYLHHGYCTPIVHCDLKPNNILFDNDMVAHIGDFGIAKILGADMLMVQTRTLGTTGYMAPEYGSEGIVSTMIDVYSFGILMMEIITKKKPTDDDFTGVFTIKRCVIEQLENDTTMEIIDDNLLMTFADDDFATNARCILSIMKLAIQCTEDLPQNRTSMNIIVVRLKKILAEFQLLP